MKPSFFIRIFDGKVVLWDYEKHTQFEIDALHLERIIQLSGEYQLSNSRVDTSIKNSQIMENEDPDEWGWDCLSRIFHVGSQIHSEHTDHDDGCNAYRGYIEYCTSILHEVPKMYAELDGVPVKLPPPEMGQFDKVSFKDALTSRATCRSFDARSLDLKTMSNALWATFGAVHGTTRSDLAAEGLMPVGYRRTSPSGGSLHPSEPYLVALRVRGLPSGVYHYRSNTHQLTHVAGELGTGRLGKLLCAQTFADDLAYGIFIVSRFDKLWWKYPHSRAYRVALLDIGCLIQTFQLICAAQGVQSWPTGYFLDHEVNSLLGIDNKTSSAMFFLGAGLGSGSVAREALAIIREKRNEAQNENIRRQTGP